MSQSPDVSIIVAAFNAEQQIGRALASALAQTGISLEVVVSDDGSTDRTAAVVKQIADDRLRLVRMPTNRGPGAARNAAIEVAKGDWIAVLDADDWMEPGRVAALIGAARSSDADIIADNLYVDTGGIRKLLVEETLDNGLVSIDFVPYLLDNRPTTGGVGYGYLKPVFRASFLKRHDVLYDPRLRIGEDFMIVAQMMVRGARYVRRRSAGYVYQKHANSISHRLGAGAADAMVEADARFLIEHGSHMSAQARAAVASHARSARDAAAFARVLDALKRGHWAAAAAQAARRPTSIGLMGEPIVKRLARLGRPR